MDLKLIILTIQKCIDILLTKRDKTPADGGVKGFSIAIRRAFINGDYGQFDSDELNTQLVRSRYGLTGRTGTVRKLSFLRKCVI